MKKLRTGQILSYLCEKEILKKCGYDGYSFTDMFSRKLWNKYEEYNNMQKALLYMIIETCPGIAEDILFDCTLVCKAHIESGLNERNENKPR